nr:mucin-3A-like [Nothobranchius furzeri]
MSGCLGCQSPGLMELLSSGGKGQAGRGLGNAASLESLGSLVVGIPSTSIESIPGSELLSASKNPALVSSMLQAPINLQETFVQKIISVDTNPAQIVVNVPDALATIIPPSQLVFSEGSANVSVINNKTWTHDQASLLLPTLAETNFDIEQFTTSILQGFTCTSAKRLTTTKTQQLIRACRPRLGRPKVELKESQLTCMYNLIKGDLNQNFTDYPSDLLLYFKIQDVQKRNCRSYFSALGIADFSVASTILNKGRQLFSEARTCLGIHGFILSRDNLNILGNMVCTLDSSYIMNSDPLILEKLKACKDFSDSQVTAMETLLLSGVSQYGTVATWTLQTLQNLQQLPLYLTRNIWGKINTATKREFLKGFMPNLRNRNTPKAKLKNLFQQITSLVSKRGAGCLSGNITDVTISDPAFPFGYDVTQFDLCLDIPVMTENLYAICSKVDDNDFQTKILKKLNQAYPSGVPEQQVQLLGSVSRVATLSDIFNWNITMIDTLAALMKTEDGNWPAAQSKEIITKYLNTSKKTLGITELNIIGSNVCTLDISTLSTITADSIRNIKRLNVSSCSLVQKRVLYEISNTSFNSFRVNSITFYNLIKGYLGGAPLIDILALSTQNISMDIDTFRSLDINVIMNLTVTNIQNLMGDQLPNLKLFENDTVIQSWINLQTQSELDTLGVGLIITNSYRETAQPTTATTAGMVSTNGPTTAGESSMNSPYSFETSTETAGTHSEISTAYARTRSVTENVNLLTSAGLFTTNYLASTGESTSMSPTSSETATTNMATNSGITIPPTGLEISTPNVPISSEITTTNARTSSFMATANAVSSIGIDSATAETTADKPVPNTGTSSLMPTSVPTSSEITTPIAVTNFLMATTNGITSIGIISATDETTSDKPLSHAGTSSLTPTSAATSAGMVSPNGPTTAELSSINYPTRFETSTRNAATNSEVFSPNAGTSSVTEKLNAATSGELVTTSNPTSTEAVSFIPPTILGKSTPNVPVSSEITSIAGTNSFMGTTSAATSIGKVSDTGETTSDKPVLNTGTSSLTSTSAAASAGMVLPNGPTTAGASSMNDPNSFETSTRNAATNSEIYSPNGQTSSVTEKINAATRDGLVTTNNPTSTETLSFIPPTSLEKSTPNVPTSPAITTPNARTSSFMATTNGISSIGIISATAETTSDKPFPNAGTSSLTTTGAAVSAGMVSLNSPTTDGVSLINYPNSFEMSTRNAATNSEVFSPNARTSPVTEKINAATSGGLVATNNPTSTEAVSFIPPTILGKSTPNVPVSSEITSHAGTNSFIGSTSAATSIGKVSDSAEITSNKPALNTGTSSLTPTNAAASAGMVSPNGPTTAGESSINYPNSFETSTRNAATNSEIYSPNGRTSSVTELINAATSGGLVTTSNPTSTETLSFIPPTILGKSTPNVPISSEITSIAETNSFMGTTSAATGIGKVSDPAETTSNKPVLNAGTSSLTPTSAAVSAGMVSPNGPTTVGVSSINYPTSFETSTRNAATNSEVFSPNARTSPVTEKINAATSGGLVTTSNPTSTEAISFIPPTSLGKSTSNVPTSSEITSHAGTNSFMGTTSAATSTGKVSDTAETTSDTPVLNAGTSSLTPTSAAASAGMVSPNGPTTVGVSSINYPTSFETSTRNAATNSEVFSPNARTSSVTEKINAATSGELVTTSNPTSTEAISSIPPTILGKSTPNVPTSSEITSHAGTNSFMGTTGAATNIGQVSDTAETTSYKPVLDAGTSSLTSTNAAASARMVSPNGPTTAGASSINYPTSFETSTRNAATNSEIYSPNGRTSSVTEKRNAATSGGLVTTNNPTSTETLSFIPPTILEKSTPYVQSSSEITPIAGTSSFMTTINAVTNIGIASATAKTTSDKPVPNTGTSSFTPISAATSAGIVSTNGPTTAGASSIISPNSFETSTRNVVTNSEISSSSAETTLITENTNVATSSGMVISNDITSTEASSSISTTSFGKASTNMGTNSGITTPNERISSFMTINAESSVGMISNKAETSFSTSVPNDGTNSVTEKTDAATNIGTAMTNAVTSVETSLLNHLTSFGKSTTNAATDAGLSMPNAGASTVTETTATEIITETASTNGPPISKVTSSDVCATFINYNNTVTFLETIVVSDDMKKVILPCFWEMALSINRTSEVNLWFDVLLKNYLRFLTKNLISPMEVQGASCQAFQKLVFYMGNNFTYNSTEFGPEDVYNTIRSYLTTGSGARCYNLSDPELNSTSWFFKYISSFVTFITLNDLISFVPTSQAEVFWEDQANLELFNNSAIAVDVRNYYITQLFTVNPSFSLFKLPGVLMCSTTIPSRVYTSLNETNTVVILDMRKQFCYGIEDPQASAALASNIKTITAQTIVSLGGAASGLSNTQISSISPTLLISLLYTLASVTTWGQDQANIIIQSITSSGYQINSTDSLESLGSLVVGLPSGLLEKTPASALLRASNNPALVSSMLQASAVLQEIFVQKIISVDTKPAEVVQNVPDVLAIQIPPSMLAFSDGSANITVINKKTWTKDQSVMFFGSLAGANFDTEQLSPFVLQGFTCTTIKTMSKKQIRQLIHASRPRTGSAKVELRESQLTCMYNLLKGDLSQNFTDYPSDMLLYFKAQDVQKSNCRTYFSALGAADFSVASSILNKAQQLFSEAKTCLGINGLNLSRDNVAVLGNMVCTLDSSYIQSSDPLILENLKACTDLSASQVAAMETLLLSGKTQYGPVATWTRQTLDNLGNLPLYLTRSIWANITTITKRSFLQSFMPSLRKIKTPKTKLKNLFNQVTPLITKRGAGCTTANITQVTVSDTAFPFGYDLIQFDYCLDISVLKENLNAICSKVDDNNFQKIILQKLNQAYPSGISDKDVQLLGSVSRVATPSDISNWNITTIDTLAALMKNEDGTWTTEQSKEIITKYLNTSGNSLSTIVLNNIRSNLCSLDPSTLSTITADSLRSAQPLNVALCSAEQKRLLYGISSSSYGLYRSNSSAYYNLIKSYLGGAPLMDIVALSTQNISMDVDIFRSLDISVITNLTVTNVKSLMGDQLPDLKLFENDTVIQTWVNFQLQSDLDTLGVGLITTRSNQISAAPSTNNNLTTAAASTKSSLSSEIPTAATVQGSTTGSSTSQSTSQVAITNGGLNHEKSPASLVLFALVSTLLLMLLPA